MKRSTLIAQLSLFGCLAAGIATAADKSSSSNKQTTMHGATNAMTEVNIKELNKNPDKFAGQQVSVTGQVEKLEGANAFILDGPGLLNDKILVVVTKPQQAGKEQGGASQQAGTAGTVIKEKENVQLTGKIETLGVAKIEEKYGPGLNTEIKTEFEGPMPILVVGPNGIKAVS